MSSIFIRVLSAYKVLPAMAVESDSFETLNQLLDRHMVDCKMCRALAISATLPLPSTLLVPVISLNPNNDFPFLPHFPCEETPCNLFITDFDTLVRFTLVSLTNLPPERPLIPVWHCTNGIPRRLVAVNTAKSQCPEVRVPRSVSCHRIKSVRASENEPNTLVSQKGSNQGSLTQQRDAVTSAMFVGGNAQQGACAVTLCQGRECCECFSWTDRDGVYKLLEPRVSREPFTHSKLQIKNIFASSEVLFQTDFL
ncbi:uncharacterized protein LOC125450572 [Stegostoma tigrinum]|uniref:uncharacterized protein LOC125450572 n=1 Tax=Stegostoma tigrinum TaxID=3053191 RepID=UPI0028707D42|nr:uncharacterized protein LOC125450572 [Stegostoma tigrinum]